MRETISHKDRNSLEKILRGAASAFSFYDNLKELLVPLMKNKDKDIGLLLFLNRKKIDSIVKLITEKNRTKIKINDYYGSFIRRLFILCLSFYLKKTSSYRSWRDFTFTFNQPFTGIMGIEDYEENMERSFGSRIRSLIPF